MASAIDPRRQKQLKNEKKKLKGQKISLRCQDIMRSSITFLFDGKKEIFTEASESLWG